MRRNCIIIDDERLAREKIKHYLSRLDGLSLKGEYATAEAFLDEWSRESGLLLFVDINLPDLNGLDLASMVSGQNQVIFYNSLFRICFGRIQFGCHRLYSKALRF